MTVLVTGASGYLGRAVAERLTSDGARVLGLIRRPEASLPSGVRPVLIDLEGDPQALQTALAGTEMVVHCAAHLGDGARDRFRRVNVAGTHALLDAAVRARVKRFVHVSSIAVYGWARPGSVVGPEHGYDPCPELRDDYAWSKIEADRWVELYRARGLLETATLRPGIIYGRGREFVARISRAIGGRFRLIFGTPRMRVPLVHVSDVVDAIVHAVRRTGCMSRPVNVVGPDCPTQAEYLALRQASRGDRARPVYLPTMATLLAARHAASRARFRVPSGRNLAYCMAWAAQEVAYDLRPAAAELGWAPRIPVSDGLGG
jgi:nucleoside-diphosphate-sugar epimerase